MPIYLQFKRRPEEGMYLPDFSVHTDEPIVEERNKRRVHALNEGESMVAGQFYLSDDKTYILCNQYQVSNIDGVPDVQLIENYTLPRFGT